VNKIVLVPSKFRLVRPSHTHTLLVSNHGTIYSTGSNNDDGRLGRTDASGAPNPSRIGAESA
jgi:alpha-tubulin suppressor-like RCC1 family protein